MCSFERFKHCYQKDFEFAHVIHEMRIVDKGFVLEAHLFGGNPKKRAILHFYCGIVDFRNENARQTTIPRPFT